jgi:hypothetical protein
MFAKLKIASEKFDITAKVRELVALASRGPHDVPGAPSFSGQGPAMRLRSLVFLASLPAVVGCQTHLSLRDNTIRTTETLTDLNYRQVLDNIALMSTNVSTLPTFVVLNSGTVTVADQKTINANANYAPTLPFVQQGGSGLPILSLLFNPSASRTLTENWSMTPVTDVDNLRRIRCALQLLILQGKEITDCDDCMEDLGRFYLGENTRMECLIPLGWYGTGGKRDVPKDACYVGHYRDCYVWVTAEGMEGLTRFTMTLNDLATGKPHAPTKTVVKTFKGDGTLDNTQVTTTEIDWDALQKKQKGGQPDRRRAYGNPPAINPGLFFIPR